MRRIARRVALVALLVSVSLAAQTPDRAYASGETVNLAEFGVSFRVPAGWTANGQPNALLLSNPSQNLIGFVFFKANSTSNEMKAFFSEKTDGILRLEQATVAGYANAWSFDFRDTDAGLIGTGRAVISASSTAALVMVMARQGSPSALGDPAENWIRALQFGGGERPAAAAPAPAKSQAQANVAPAAPPANSPFTGRQIHGVKTYRGGDFFEMTTINLDLCRDGTYAAVIKKESSSVSGTLGPSQKTDRETGTWSIAGTGTEWTMTLRNSQGASSTVLIRNSGGLRFGDMSAELLQTETCR